MAFEIPGKKFTLIAGANYNSESAQYTAIAQNAAGQAVAPAAGGSIIGVCQNKPDTGTRMTVMSSGVTKFRTGGAVPVGPVAVDGLGRCVVPAAGNRIVGRALEGAAAAGILIPVLLENEGVV